MAYNHDPVTLRSSASESRLRLAIPETREAKLLPYKELYRFHHLQPSIWHVLGKCSKSHCRRHRKSKSRCQPVSALQFCNTSTRTLVQRYQYRSESNIVLMLCDSDRSIHQIFQPNMRGLLTVIMRKEFSNGCGCRGIAT